MSERIHELAEETGMTQYVAANNKYLERFAQAVILEYSNVCANCGALTNGDEQDGNRTRKGSVVAC